MAAQSMEAQPVEARTVEAPAAGEPAVTAAGPGRPCVAGVPGLAPEPPVLGRPAAPAGRHRTARHPVAERAGPRLGQGRHLHRHRRRVRRADRRPAGGLWPADLVSPRAADVLRDCRGPAGRRVLRRHQPGRLLLRHAARRDRRLAQFRLDPWAWPAGRPAPAPAAAGRVTVRGPGSGAGHRAWPGTMRADRAERVLREGAGASGADHEARWIARDPETGPRGHAARPGRPAAARSRRQRGAARGRQPARLHHPRSHPVPVTQSHADPRAQRQPDPGSDRLGGPDADGGRVAHRQSHPRPVAQPGLVPQPPEGVLGQGRGRAPAWRSARPSSRWSPARRCCSGRPTRAWRRFPRPAGRRCR